MKIAELIEKLKEFPPDSEAVLFDDGGNYSPLEKLQNLKYSGAFLKKELRDTLIDIVVLSY